MNLSDWADRVGVSKHTAYDWWHEGTRAVPAERVGWLILVDVENARATHARTVVHARVSSHGQRVELYAQVARLTEWVAAQGIGVDEVVGEVGSGIDVWRRKLARVLADSTATTIVVEHRDRLARFGVEHLEAALSAQMRAAVVVDEGQVEDDLALDMVEVLTSFCARIYGRRGARNRAEKALRRAKNDLGAMALMHPSEKIAS